ncbi:plastocyanin/azurin family copper-binding protein [Ketobacter sp.]|uniref:cupredoxin domain-containing protein n=1 Tax=Ketobacter sp. TaxID=2083498 RepID=UPI000F2C3427|nr:plastocyanin/azurin family copper-binding protein [Ketobacter sp.]RLT95037.1 MAG: methylamine utilization protein [Ketobacter sp.]
MHTRLLLIVPTLLFSTNLLAEQFEVGQKDKKFTQDQLTIKVGDTVKFTNNDPFFHNVFSLSDAEMFDLGSYPQGESRDVTFETAGEVEVECAIHPEMRMTIQVQE